MLRGSRLFVALAALAAGSGCIPPPATDATGAESVATPGRAKTAATPVDPAARAKAAARAEEARSTAMLDVGPVEISVGILRARIAAWEKPAPDEIDAAREAAKSACAAAPPELSVRACKLRVSLEWALFEDAKRRYAASGGKEGIAPRKKPEIQRYVDGERDVVVKEPVPDIVSALIIAMDHYIVRVPPELDPGHIDAYRVMTAGYLFVYGLFDQARKRFDAVSLTEKETSPLICTALIQRTILANLQGDISTSRAMAETLDGRGCLDLDGRPLERISTHCGGPNFYPESSAAFRDALALPEGPERRAALAKAAELYERDLRKDPAVDEAPEAGINGAYCYDQAGLGAKAIALLRFFIAEYAPESGLAELKASDPKLYAERLKYLLQAQNMLAAKLVMTLDYAAAADVYDTITASPRFEVADRRIAARNAVILHLWHGDRKKALAARTAFFFLDPDKRGKADVDLLVAIGGFEAWEARADDTDAVRDARRDTVAALENWVKAYERVPEATDLLVEAAYRIAQVRRGAKDKAADAWCKKAESAFARWSPKVRRSDASPITPSRQGDMAAECAYLRVDARIRAELDSPVSAKVTSSLDAASQKIESTYGPDLQAIIDKHGSRVWGAAARARQGSLYDALRARLLAARASGQSAKATDARVASVEQAMIRRYVDALAWARPIAAKTPALDRAALQLALYAQQNGQANIRAAEKTLVDPFEPVAAAVVSTGRIAALGKPLSSPPTLVAPPLVIGAFNNK